jgi:glycerophosphoryl diester phosphodiesterase
MHRPRSAYPSPVPGPLLIAHRGACGHRPELTRAALLLAIEQRAQAIEVDVVASADGALVLRHEPELAGTTDVAARPAFAARRRAKDVAGRTVRGWFAEDLTLAELRTLRARERIARLRPESAAHDGEEGVLTLAEALAVAAAGGVRLVVELKHPSRSARLGLPLEELLLAELHKAPALPALTVESFEHDALRRLADARLPHPLVALIGDHPLADLRTVTDPRAFTDFAGVSLRTGLARPRTVAGFRSLGLDVWTWALRPENRYLPPRYRLPAGRHGRYGAYWRRLVAAGVTGVFADHPDLARAVVGASDDVGVPAYP